MKVAITIWENRISPVFDSSRMLLIAEIKDAKVIDKKYMTFNPEMPSYLIDNLNRMDIAVLICGAVSEIPAKMIEAGGISLIPFVAGHADEVLASYAKETKISSGFLMPGCKNDNDSKSQRSGKGKQRKRKGGQRKRKLTTQMGRNPLD